MQSHSHLKQQKSQLKQLLKSHFKQLQSQVMQHFLQNNKSIKQSHKQSKGLLTNFSCKTSQHGKWKVINRKLIGTIVKQNIPKALTIAIPEPIKLAIAKTWVTKTRKTYLLVFLKV